MNTQSLLEIDRRHRIQTAVISIVAGVLILAIKFWAFSLTGSTALKSDAYEGTVNVIAAFFALGAILFGEQPADAEHPYGHGKIEHFSAAFEGGLISLAAVLIVYEGISSLISPTPLKQLDIGLALNFFAGVLNGLLGYFLIRRGRRLKSSAIEADGHHVLSDFVTSLALILGVAIVWLTGVQIIDSILGIAMGLWLAYIGFKLVQESSSALLDVEDPKILAELTEVLQKERPPEVLALHGLRTLRTGRYIHADVHVVVPEFMPLREVHDLTELYFEKVMKSAGHEGEFHSHLDPCMKEFCQQCSLEKCPIRKLPFKNLSQFKLEEITQPEVKEVNKK